MKFESQVNREAVGIVGDPKIGRDFGFTKIARYEPSEQDSYTSVRDTFRVEWECSIEQGRQGIKGVDINLKRVVGEYVLEMWADDPELEGEIDIEVDGTEENGWYLTYEIIEEREGFYLRPQEIEIDLNSRQIKVSF